MSQLVFGLLVLTIALPFGALLLSGNKKKHFKKALAVNIFSFFAVLAGATIFTFTGYVGAAETATASGLSSPLGMAYLSAALAVGLCGIGSSFAVASSASAAIGALSENEGIMGKALIFVALAEGICIYGLIIAIMILGKV